MRRKLLIVTAIAACLILVLMFVVFSRPAGSLVYEGRHLAEWLPLVQSPSQQERDQAEQAIREIGTNALSFLEELVRNAHFNSFKVKTDKWIFREEHPVHEIRRMVFSGYGALGDIAKPSVPHLLEMLKDSEPTVRSTAIGALGWIGPAAREAVPDLIAQLDDNVGYIRRGAASALGRICAGSNDARVVQALTEALNDEDADVRKYAGRSLKSVRGDADSLE
jgi:HEAT repeat protein